MKPFNSEWMDAPKVKTLPKVYHVSNPLFRDIIYQNGLIPQQGNCHNSYSYPSAIFVSNVPDIKHPEMFDSTWDDDIWEIDISKTNNTFFQDINFNTDYYCFTLTEISPNALTLIKKGTGENNF